MLKVFISTILIPRFTVSQNLIDDKEALSMSVTSSHEKHEEHINNLEGRIGDRERGFTDKLVFLFTGCFCFVFLQAPLTQLFPKPIKPI